MPAAECQDSDCRVDGDKVLIECAMGARWGFYKFPPAPQDADPVGERRLVWREMMAEVQLLDDDSVARQSSGGEAVICFRSEPTIA